jgi:hypothetical protein
LAGLVVVLADPLAEGGKKRLPRELDAHLYKVAMEARNTHPQGHIAASITQRLVKCLPFNERTIKVAGVSTHTHTHTTPHESLVNKALSLTLSYVVCMSSIT